MDGVHGVDVSWLHHHSNKPEHLKLKKPSSKPQTTPDRRAPSPPHSDGKTNHERKPESTPPPPQRTEPVNGNIPIVPSTPIPVKSSTRKGLLSRASSEKLSHSSSSPEDVKTSKRPNWISSLSSKFSSQSHASAVNSSPQNHNHVKATTPPLKSPSKDTLPNTTADGSEDPEALEPYVPQQPKSGNFFSSAIRRFSSGSQQPVAGKLATQGTTCPRQVLNIDKDRQRCNIKELDQKKLRRVAFSVDVEVVGVSRYAESDDSGPVDASMKAKDKKLQARSEGEALKNPHLFKEEKEKMSTAGDPPARRSNSSGSIDDILESEMLAAARQQEVQAAQQKRKDSETPGSAAKTKDAAEPPAPPLSPKAAKEGPAVAHGSDRPTTDPVRMYRRCCQLREAPVLKRISEQLSNMKAEVEKTGIVTCLDLNGSRMQLPDIVCLGDWLAIVPVKRLLLDNANLTDEGVRVILAGLLATKAPDQVKRKRGKSNPPRTSEIHPRLSSGVIEKLSLRMNTKITGEGWRLVCLFLNLSLSLRAFDMSMTPFPSTKYPTTAQGAEQTPPNPEPNTGDLAHVFYLALMHRPKASHLEELILSDCGLNTYAVSKIVDAVSGSGISRLGLAKNHLDLQAIQHVARYVQSGSCKGLDIGGNDISNSIDILANSMNEKTPLWALCVADCNMSPETLSKLMPHFLTLPDFRFLDISHNRNLFSTEPSALHTLTKYMPQMKCIRRIQLNDTGMSPQQAIAIANTIPEVRNLNHVSFLENPEIRKLASCKDIEDQEESCAFYASLMWAARISKTLMAVDVEEPTADMNEVIRALYKQTIAYAFRNIDRYTSAEAMTSSDPYGDIPDEIDPSKDVQTPEILAHLVGHGDADAYQVDEHEPMAPDQDYIVGGTGVVKALGYVLNQRGQDSRRVSMAVSGNVTPTQVTTEQQKASKKKAREMALNMLGSARKIHCRIRHAMQVESNQEDEILLRRLQFLDHTLQTMIARFENEHPDCQGSAPPCSMSFSLSNPTVSTPLLTADNPIPGPDQGSEPVEPTENSQHSRSRSNSDVSFSGPPPRPSSADASQLASAPNNGSFPPPGSRRASTASLAAKVQALEEGQMHRFGQRLRRDILPPSGTDDYLHRTSTTDPMEAEHLQTLRKRLEDVGGEELRQSVLDMGLDATVKRWGEEADRIERRRTSEADDADDADSGSR